MGIAIDPAITDLEGIKNILSQLNDKAIEELNKALEQAGVSAEGLGVDLGKVKDKTEGLKSAADEAKRMTEEFN
jgi:hypothetical protein